MRSSLLPLPTASECCMSFMRLRSSVFLPTGMILVRSRLAREWHADCPWWLHGGAGFRKSQVTPPCTLILRRWINLHKPCRNCCKVIRRGNNMETWQGSGPKDSLGQSSTNAFPNILDAHVEQEYAHCFGDQRLREKLSQLELSSRSRKSLAGLAFSPPASNPKGFYKRSGNISAATPVARGKLRCRGHADH